MDLSLRNNQKISNNMVIFFAIFVLLIIGVFAFIIFGLKERHDQNTTLEFWCVYDDSDVYNGLLKQFNNVSSYIKVNYRKKDYETYENELINALASGRGPDIFCIHNTWLYKHGSKLTAMPEEMMTIRQYKDSFVDVAYNDFVYNQRIYAMPLFVDTLALYYNKDLFAKYGVASPPVTWDQFKEAVKKLTVKDQWGNIIQAGAAIGTADNINRGVDILSLLMIQSGTKMVDDKIETAVFDRAILLNNEIYESGTEALEFYTDFSNSSKDIYTYNNLLPYSIDAFYQGKTAMMFNYSFHIPTIEAKSAYFNFAVAPMPQLAGAQKKVNYANYWALSVSNLSGYSEEAWTFIKWITEKEQAQQYAKASKRPVARFDLVDWQKNEINLGIFSEQILSAVSWPQFNEVKIEEIFNNMIRLVINGEKTPVEAIRIGAGLVTELMRGK